MPTATELSAKDLVSQADTIGPDVWRPRIPDVVAHLRKNGIEVDSPQEFARRWFYYSHSAQAEISRMYPVQADLRIAAWMRDVAYPAYVRACCLMDKAYPGIE